MRVGLYLLLAVGLLVGCLSLAGSSCRSGFTRVGDYCVANDYYKVGGIRTPMGMPEVNKLLVKTGMSLPTKELVDRIWQEATCRVKPQPMHWKTDYKVHDKVVNKQVGSCKGLTAGHKKDIIKQRKKGRVTIYGWHRPNGVPIQPVSSVHDENYYDYSHGIRLVYLKGK